MVAILLIASYVATFSWINPPVTEGWFIAYADAMNAGKQIYTDYDLFLPPLYTWLTHQLVNIFGTNFTAFKLLGLSLIISIYIQLRIVYENFFDVNKSIIAATLSTFFYTTNNAFISYDFTHVLTLFTLLSLNCSLRYLKTGGEFLLFLCNAFSILAYFTKHSNGSYMILFSAIFNLSVCFTNGFKIGLLRLLKQLSYAIIFSFVIHFPLFITENFDQYFDQIYKKSVSLKGGYEKVMFQWAKGFFTMGLISNIKNVLAGFCVFFAIATFVQCLYHKSRFNALKYCKNGNVVYFVVLFAGVLYIYFAGTSYPFQENFYKTFASYIIPTAFVFSLLVLLIGLFTWKRYGVNKYVVVGTFSLLMFCANGSSAGLSQISSFVMLGFVYGTASSIYPNNLHQIGLALTAAIFSICFAAEKFENPYHWWEINSPRVMYNGKLTFNGGFFYSGSNLNYEVSIQSLDKCKRGEEALAFPNISYFYTVTNCYPNSRVLVPWFDFASQDSLAQLNATIANTKFKYIAFMDVPENVYAGHEFLFNGGKKMQQRETIRLIKEVVASESYNLVNKFDFPNSSSIYIYKRR